MSKGKRLRAQRERAREEHARLVVQRAGDPAYPQRQRTPDGYEFELDAETAELINQQQQGFRERFGRDPGPDDPLLFDPDLDEPTPMSEAKVTAAVRAAITAAGLDPAYADAFERLGYLVTEDTRHLFTAHQVEAWDAAVVAAEGSNRS